MANFPGSPSDAGRLEVLSLEGRYQTLISATRPERGAGPVFKSLKGESCEVSGGLTPEKRGDRKSSRTYDMRLWSTKNQPVVRSYPYRPVM